MKPGYILLLFIVVLLFHSSCKEEEAVTDYNPNVKSSKEYIYAEDILFEIINVYLKGITDTAVLNSHYAYLDNCAIFFEPGNNRMIFDYGEVNRWCPDNKFRRGKFTVDFEGAFFTEGSRGEFSLDSLFVDDELVEGSINSDFQGQDDMGREQVGFTLLDGRITLNDTTLVSPLQFSCSYLLTWQEGQQTPSVHEDDMFTVVGTGNGMSLDNVQYTVVVQDPLINYLDCFWIAYGTHQITVPSAKITEGIIDYITSDDCFYKVDFYFGESYFYENLKY
jgi:hypothetical protein